MGDLYDHILSAYKDEWGASIRLGTEPYRTWEGMEEGERKALIDKLNADCLFPVTFTPESVVHRGSPETIDLTDRGNALRLIRHFGGRALYMNHREKWMYWDGHHWTYDEEEYLYRKYVPLVINELRDEAGWETVSNPKLGDRIYKFMLSSQNTMRVRNMFTEAKRIDGCLRVSPDDMDAPSSRYLLNCRNATIDLRTGADIGQRLGNFVSKQAPVTYDPDAESQLWLETIDRIFESRPELVPFIRRMFGSALAGDIDDGKFFFLWGEGQNGKGTMLETLEKVLGLDQYGYAQHAEASTFMQRREGGGMSNDIACLKGARSVVVGEVENLRNLNISLLKSITGGDPLKARMMWEEYFTFFPQFKLFFQGNHRPELGVINKAIERRFVYIPFLEQIPDWERDDKLKEKLVSEENKAGILNWYIEGARDWLNPPKGADRLRIPEFVQSETKDYLDDLDPVGAFLAQCTVEDEGCDLPHKYLHELYNKWARVCDKEQLSTQRLSNVMQDKGYRKIKPGNKITWKCMAFNDGERVAVEDEYETIVRTAKGESADYYRLVSEDGGTVYG